MHEKLIILDFGSQTTQLIGRRVRELNMYCEIVPYNKFPHDATDVKGVILSGSPYSVYDANAFKADLYIRRKCRTGQLPRIRTCQPVVYRGYGRITERYQCRFANLDVPRRHHHGPPRKLQSNRQYGRCKSSGLSRGRRTNLGRTMVLNY